jgi:hypothetical protein
MKINKTSHIVQLLNKFHKNIEYLKNQQLVFLLLLHKNIKIIVLKIIFNIFSLKNQK